MSDWLCPPIMCIYPKNLVKIDPVHSEINGLKWIVKNKKRRWKKVTTAKQKPFGTAMPGRQLRFNEKNSRKTDGWADILVLLLSAACSWRRLSAYGRSDDVLIDKEDEDDDDNDDDDRVELTKAKAATKLILGGSWRDGGMCVAVVEGRSVGDGRLLREIVSRDPEEVKFKLAGLRLDWRWSSVEQNCAMIGDAVLFPSWRVNETWHSSVCLASLKHANVNTLYTVSRKNPAGYQLRHFRQICLYSVAARSVENIGGQKAWAGTGRE